MQTLETSVMALARHEMNNKTRIQAVKLLQDTISDLEAATAIWTEFAKSASGSTDGAFAGWAGSQMERDLYDIHLSAREKLLEVTNGATSLDDPLVELAYSKLMPGQSSKGAAENAADVMKSRIGLVQKLIKAVETTKPVKLKVAAVKAKPKAAAKKGGATKKATAKTTAKKKAAKKKAAKKAVTKKKVAKKKVVKKKAAKKPAKKKAAAKKKPAKKKAVAKKKTTGKKKAAAKKKTNTKKPSTKKKAAGKTTAKRKK